MKFTQIPATTFQSLQLNAGVLASDFTPSTGSLTASNILGATTGGVTFNATPSFSDFGDDIDNCPKNMLELKKLDSWEVKLTGTFATMTAELAKKIIGAGDIGEIGYVKTADTAIVSGKDYYTRSGTDPNYTYTKVTTPAVADIATYYEQVSAKVTPRKDVLTTDFSDMWWIGDYSDKNGDTNGGFVAIHMLNSLSTGGFQIRSTDKGKGNFAFEFTGHYSQAAQNIVPFEVYVHAGTAESA